eukprot:jgi/Mesvir1/25529/Mv01777-RA.1
MSRQRIPYDVSLALLFIIMACCVGGSEEGEVAPGACPTNWKGMYFGHVEKSGGGIMNSIIVRAMFKSGGGSHSQQMVTKCIQENFPNEEDSGKEATGGLELIPHSCWNAESVRKAWARFGRQFPHKCGWINTHYDFRLFTENIEPKMPKWREHIALATMLREPVGRTVSAYFFARREHSKGPLRGSNLSLREFADIENMVNMAARNYQVKYYGGARPHCSPHWPTDALITSEPAATDATLSKAKENLSKFCAVGIYEYLQDSLHLILTRLGLADRLEEVNLANEKVVHSSVPPGFVLTDEDRQYILSKNELDQRLYEHAVAIFRQQFVATFGREPQRSPPHKHSGGGVPAPKGTGGLLSSIHQGMGMVKEQAKRWQHQHGGNGTHRHPHRLSHAAMGLRQRPH